VSEERFKQRWQRVTDLWSLTRFGPPGLSEYAEKLVFLDARKGVVALAVVSLLLLSSATLLYAVLGFDRIYIYTCSVLAALSLHMAISARAVQEIQVLYLLGITLLVVNGVAFVLLAHQAGSFDSALFGSVVLLFLVMPLVPWGLREALVIVLLIYLVFTLSTLSVGGRFEGDTLWMLQFVMFSAGIATLTVIARTVLVRKHDITSRYELEKARHRMEMLSLKDPLTGAWNRRFLEQKFDDIVADYRRKGVSFNFALIDVDDFKQLNDHKGHDYGDLVLRRLVANFLVHFTDHEHMVRIGGDEFALLYACDNPEQLVVSAAAGLKSDPQLDVASAGDQVHISTGIISIDPGSGATLDAVYRAADKALYDAKARVSGQKNSSGFVRQALEG
jgi:diguanylate cyclase (GGDEF)-like protein